MVSATVSEVTAAAAPPIQVKKSESRSLSFHYGSFQALKSISMPISAVTFFS